jgi:hypothetical protein
LQSFETEAIIEVEERELLGGRHPTGQKGEI